MNEVESRKLEDVQGEEGITVLVHSPMDWNVHKSWASDYASRPQHPFILCTCKVGLGVLTTSLLSAGLYTLCSPGLLLRNAFGVKPALP